MIIYGINSLNHDSSLAVVENGKVIFHERSGYYLEKEIIKRALEHGYPNLIVWYEKPWLKKTRQLYAGQYAEAFDLDKLPSCYLSSLGLGNCKVVYVSHHHSHAAGAYYTSNYEDAAVIVADAIGEWETISIWHGKKNTLTKLWSDRYPYSLGLFYSAFTDMLGFIPVKEENLLTQLALTGKPIFVNRVAKYLTENCHIGINDWEFEDHERADIAASVQFVFENEISRLAQRAKQLTKSNNVIFTGGCAYNKPAQDMLSLHFDNCTVPKFPGDSGSSFGAVAAFTNRNLTL
jgi:carbamoyltransferase